MNETQQTSPRSIEIYREIKSSLDLRWYEALLAGRMRGLYVDITEADTRRTKSGESLSSECNDHYIYSPSLYEDRLQEVYGRIQAMSGMMSNYHNILEKYHEDKALNDRLEKIVFQSILEGYHEENTLYDKIEDITSPFVSNQQQPDNSLSTELDTKMDCLALEEEIVRLKLEIAESRTTEDLLSQELQAKNAAFENAQKENERFLLESNMMRKSRSCLDLSPPHCNAELNSRNLDTTYHNGEAQFSEEYTEIQERRNPINKFGDLMRRGSNFVAKKKKFRSKSCDSTDFDFIPSLLPAPDAEPSTHNNNRSIFGAKILPVRSADPMDIDLDETNVAEKIPPSTRQDNQNTRSPDHRLRLNRVGNLFRLNSNFPRKPLNPPQKITRSNSWTSFSNYEKEQQEQPDERSHFQRFFSKRTVDSNESFANDMELPAETNMRNQFQKHSATNLRGMAMSTNSCSSFSNHDDIILRDPPNRLRPPLRRFIGERCSQFFTENSKNFKSDEQFPSNADIPVCQTDAGKLNLASPFYMFG